MFIDLGRTTKGAVIRQCMLLYYERTASLNYCYHGVDRSKTRPTSYCSQLTPMFMGSWSQWWVVSIYVSLV